MHLKTSLACAPSLRKWKENQQNPTTLSLVLIIRNNQFVPLTANFIK